MSDPADALRRHEALLAALLRFGTWAACLLMVAGAFLDLPGASRLGLPDGVAAMDVIKAGIALLIFLPVARVALMLVLFLNERDYVYTAIAALVLAIIGAGFFFAR
jgi:hypothetical protein